MGNSGEKTAVAAVLTRKFARFLRSASVYPATNPRVQAAQSSLQESVKEFFAHESSLVIRFLRDALEVSETILDPNHPDFAWMKLHFLNARLGGLIIAPEVSGAALLDFCNQLLKNRELAATGSQFQDLWSQTITGIVPLEMESSGAKTGGLATGSSESKTPTEWGGRVLLHEDKVQEILHGRRDIIKQLEKISTAAGGQREIKVLLGQVLNHLPEEQLADNFRTACLVGHALDAAERILATLRINAEEKGSVLLDQVLTAAAERVSVTMPDAEPTAEEGLRPVRQRMAECSSDARQKVLAEWMNMPEKWDPELQEDVRGECLGAHLHLLLDPLAVGETDRYHGYVLSVLEDPVEEEKVLFNSFLEPLKNGGEDDEGFQEARNVLLFLKDGGLDQLINNADSLSMAAIKASFPLNFQGYLDQIDARNPADARELNLLCQDLGAQRIAEDEDFLAGRDGILGPERIQKLLAMHGRALFPLLIIILKFRGRAYTQECTRFLARSGLTLREAAPFTVCEGLNEFPADYLLQLCLAEIEGKGNKKLADFAGIIIRKFVDDIRDNRNRLHQRAQAVRSLANFPSPETEMFLDDLCRGSGFLGLKKAPPEIRAAAKKAREVLGNKGKGGRK